MNVQHNMQPQTLEQQPELLIATILATALRFEAAFCATSWHQGQ
jgi:hypothetical protein